MSHNILNLPDWAPAPPKSVAAEVERAERLSAESAPLGAAVRAARFHGDPERQAPEVRERYRLALDTYESAMRSVEGASRAAAHEAFATRDQWKPKLTEALDRKLSALLEDIERWADDFADMDVVIGMISRLTNTESLQGKAARFETPHPGRPMSLEFAGTLGRTSVPASDLPRLLAAVCEHVRALAPDEAPGPRPARRLVPAEA